MDWIAEKIFNDRRPVYERLIGYGFEYRIGRYEYSASIACGKLLVRVSVFESGAVVSEVIDTAFDEPYILHLVADAVGEFTVRVRDEYFSILSDIAEKCFKASSIAEGQAERVLKYISEKYKDNIECPWDDYDGGGVRRKDNRKWYAVLLRVAAKKFFLELPGKVTIINLKVAKGTVQEIIDGKNIFPAYHMNKQSWISIVLDDNIADEQIEKLIDGSYNLAGG